MATWARRHEVGWRKARSVPALTIVDGADGCRIFTCRCGYVVYTNGSKYGHECRWCGAGYSGETKAMLTVRGHSWRWLIDPLCFICVDRLRYPAQSQEPRVCPHHLFCNTCGHARAYERADQYLYTTDRGFRNLYFACLHDRGKEPPAFGAYWSDRNFDFMVHHHWGDDWRKPPYRVFSTVAKSWMTKSGEFRQFEDLQDADFRFVSVRAAKRAIKVKLGGGTLLGYSLVRAPILKSTKA